MAASLLPDRRIRHTARAVFCVIALAAYAVPAGIAAAATPATGDRPISLDAASSDFDYRNNRLVFRKVRISQGDLSVTADEATATGLSFENSEWQFSGAVHIDMPDGMLESEAAVVTFRDNRITHARITGNPASFEQRRPAEQPARGRAGLIEYDVTRGTVALTGQAWLTDGRNEITGATLVYDITRERVFANPGEQDPGGVSITINPRAPGTPPATPPAAPPAGPAP